MWADINKSVVLSAIQTIFSHKSSKYLAEMSYSVYIFHLVLMLPFFAYVLKDGKLSTMTWIISSIILLIFTMLVSHFIYKYIEIPGINIAKRLVK